MRNILSFFLLSISLLSTAKNALAPNIVVAADGSGDFTTVQEAVNSVEDHSQKKVNIFIKKGIYKEKIVISSAKTNISLIGEDKNHTIITNDDFSGKPRALKDSQGNDKYTTGTSYTMLVQAGDFSARNLTIENSAGEVGQAVALHIEGDRCTINNCRLLGNQDTLYTGGEKSRQYFEECYIEGTTDFIFGGATAIFFKCIIKSLKNSYITAASTLPEQAFGYVFINCKLIAADAVDKVFLGRPWRPYAKTVFISTEMKQHIVPEGWHNWGKLENEKTAFYAEYNSKGPGAENKEQRVPWSRQLLEHETRVYTLQHIFKDWNPQ